MSPATHYGPPMSRVPKFLKSSMTTSKNGTDTSLQAILDAPDSERSQHINYDALRALMNDEPTPESPASSPTTPPDPTPPTLPPPSTKRGKGTKRPLSPAPADSSSPSSGPSLKRLARTTAKASSSRKFGTPLDTNSSDTGQSYSFTFESPSSSSSPPSKSTKQARKSTPPPPTSAVTPSTIEPPPATAQIDSTSPSSASSSVNNAFTDTNNAPDSVSDAPAHTHTSTSSIEAASQGPGDSKRALPPIPRNGKQLPIHSRYLALKRLSGRRKPVKSALHKSFRDAAARAAEAYLQDPCDRTVYQFLQLPKRYLTPACQGPVNGGKKLLQRFLHKQEITPEPEWPAPPLVGPEAERDKVADAEKLIQTGRLGTACRVLTEDTKVAPANDANTDELIAKHPQGSPKPFDENEGPRNCKPPSCEQIMAALDSFDPQTAPGVSGWTVGMLKIVKESPKVQEFFVTLIAGICAGTAPGRSMLCTGSLTALEKKGGGVRPIAVGELLYRLAMKSILVNALDGKSPLLPNQLGVKTKGGVEPLVRTAERAVSGELDQKYTHVISLDAINAFNNMSRKAIAAAIRKYLPGLYRCARWAYQEESDLVFGEFVISSSEGVRQGDPLGPLLYSLGLRPILEALQAHLGPGRKVIAYLDDIFIFSTDDKALADTQSFLLAYSDTIKLNPSKCQTISIKEIADKGFAMLGTVVGSRQARVDFLREAIARTKVKLGRLRGSLHFQSALLILRKCISADLRHLQRTLRTDDMLDEWNDLDIALWDEIKHLRGRQDIEGPDGLEDDCVGRAVTALPSRYGGLDLLSHRDVAPLARAAYIESSDLEIDRIFSIKSQTSREEIQPRSQKERCKEMWEGQRDELMRRVDPVRAMGMLENASLLGRSWLNIIPYFQPLRLADSAISTGLHVRTLARSFRPVCLCGAPAEFLHHDVCSRIGGTKRHNDIRDDMAAALRHLPATTVLTEPTTDEGRRRNDIGIRDGQSTSAHLMVRGPGETGRRNIDYDLKVYSANSTLVFRRGRGAVKPPAADVDPVQHYQAISDKWMAKVAQGTDKNKPETQVDFRPLVMSAGGIMSKDTLREVQGWKLGKWEESNLMSSMSTTLLLSRTRKMGACLLNLDYLPGFGPRD